VTHPRYLDHDTGAGHPERPARLEAVWRGLEAADLPDALVRAEPVPASSVALERVHRPELIRAVEAACAAGDRIDADTVVSPASWDAARLAAGAGLTAVERLSAGEGDAAFCVVRPPGHHASATRAMGFCLFNNVAVTAAALAAAGERVLIVDYDAHHGNGTQAVFYDDARVAYVSLHQWPLYPGTGSADERGAGEAEGTNLNVPLPPGATGDVYRVAVDELVRPLADRFKPTWLLLSAGFDAHRRDPLTGLALAAGDYADLTRDLLTLAPPGRRLLFLEGGYDLDALADSTGAAIAAAAGIAHRPEPATGGGPGRSAVDALVERERRELTG
jgi:acetoin utilization deacetylase AcuC-like enzyme